MGFVKIICKTAKIIWILIAALLLFELVDSFFYSSYAVWTRQASALFNLYPDSTVETLPEHVSITIDGCTAKFRKGSPDYDRFLGLLRAVPDEKARIAAGPYPDAHISITRGSTYCGKLTIPCCGIPFHFRLYRSTSNRNYLWVELPKLNSPGTTYPEIIEDGRLLRFVQNTEKQQNRTSRD